MANGNSTPQPASEGKPALISVSPEILQKMIEDGVIQVMDQLKDVDSHKVADLDYDKLGSAIGDAVAVGMTKMTRPKVTNGQYVRRAYSVYHTDGVGDHKRPKLQRECYVNGDYVNDTRVTDNEIRLFNRITHSGRYIDRMVEVIVSPNGSSDSVQVRFSNKLENYMPLKAKCKDLEAILQQVVDVQEAEDREAEVDATVRQELREKVRSHMNTKATREAREKAGITITD